MQQGKFLKKKISAQQGKRIRSHFTDKRKMGLQWGQDVYEMVTKHLEKTGISLCRHQESRTGGAIIRASPQRSISIPTNFSWSALKAGPGTARPARGSGVPALINRTFRGYCAIVSGVISISQRSEARLRSRRT